MVGITVRETKDRILKRLSIASGQDVSIYSEGPLNEIIQHKIDVLFDHKDIWWPVYYEPGLVVTIDANGLPTQSLADVFKEYRDIRMVFLGNSDVPLPRVSTRVNLANVKLPSIISNPDPAKPFRIIGNKGSATTVTVAGKIRPDPLRNDEDVILLDDQLIILGSAYDYLSDLGTNPGQEDKLLTLFNQRLGQLEEIIRGNMEVSMQDYAAPAANLEWSERGW